MLPTKFQIIWLSSFRGEECLKSANQKQESPVVVMFVNGSPLKPLGQMIGNLVGSIYGRSSIKIAHSVPIH
jgi:hypothetical protein